QGAGQLGGYDPETDVDCCEGFVLRSAGGFYTNNDRLPVARNEFDSLAKLVRAKHVKTDVHWTKNWQPAQLMNYHTHGWSAYQYLSQ
ncbi:MAG: 2'-5' RNA ligase, partial [Bacteroidota bacterium]